MSGMDINYLKYKIEEKLNHSYIKKIMGNPTIDEDKLILLTSLIGNQSSLSIKEKERFIITATLIQIALDTHDEVPTSFHQGMSNDLKAQNQLRVLAGDFYSGQYYFLLAEINEIELISTFASAIKEINEYKMELYYLENSTLEESISIANRIDQLLFFYLAEYVQDDSLNELATEWLLINRLMREKNNLSNGIESIFLRSLKKDAVSNQIGLFIQKRIPSLEILIPRLPNEHSELKTYISKRMKKTVKKDKTSIVEEG